MMDIPRNWTFENTSVATEFDQHVREQLPWYDLVTGIVSHLARHYIPRGGLVYDIGASTGNIGRAIAHTLQSRDARLIAIESSAEMVERYAGPGQIIHADATGFDFAPCDFAVCFLVVMFMPPRIRGAFLLRLFERILPGGALVVVDKCAPVSGYPSVVLQRLALAGKIAAGVSPEQVLEKELSLSGVQRPVYLNELPAGGIEVFRFGDFAGWLFEKPIE
jgi:tRNA (cmo5U34)-methyltransferase